MKQFAAYTAAALLAAPVCMVAHAADANAFVDQSVEFINNLSSILDRVTPENAEQMNAELLAQKPQADKLKQMAEEMTEEENKALSSDPAATAKLTGAMMSLFASMGKLQSIMEDEKTTPEQKEAIQKLAEALDSIMSDDDEDDDNKD